MPKSRSRAGVLTAFACWLVLLASADDFNLARLVLPLADVDSEGLLSLDDPNSDFTEPSRSREPPTTYRHRCSWTTFVGQSLTRTVLTSPFAAFTLGHPPRPGSDSPLRC